MSTKAVSSKISDIPNDLVEEVIEEKKDVLDNDSDANNSLATDMQNSNGQSSSDYSQDQSSGDYQGNPSQGYSSYGRGNDRTFQRGGYREQDQPTEEVSGILDIQHEGHGFLRPKFRPSERDVYISASQIRRFWLRAGDLVEGEGRPPKDNERYFGLLKVLKVNGQDAEKIGKRPYFEDLTSIYPNRHIVLSTGKDPLSTRMIDIVSPIGFGQRGMIVSPPQSR